MMTNTGMATRSDMTVKNAIWYVAGHSVRGGWRVES